MLDYDKVLESVGEIGTYQKRLCFFMFMMTFPNGILVPSVIFNNVAPDFRCAVPGLSNDSFAIRNEHHKSLVQGTIPHDGEHYSHCELYDLENATLTSASLAVSPVTEQGVNNFTSRIPCDRWVYDDTGHHTQVPDFDLVCDRVIYKAHGNTMILMGLLVGSLIGGSVSDFMGRKKTILLGTMTTICIGVGTAWAQSIHLMMALRFLLLAACSYSFLAAFVMLCETLGTSKRSMATMATMLGYSIGQYVCVLVQYLVEDWRTAQLVLSLPLLSFVGFWWLIQESPRWLLAKGREKEARSIIERIAKVNKACLPQEMEIMNNTDQLTSSRDEKGVDDVTNTSGSKQMKIWAICADRKVAFRLVILCFSWTTINMVYYGLMLGVGDIIEGNIFINFLLQAVMETSAHLICILILEKLDRKRIYCSAMILTGLSMLGIGAVNLTQISNAQWLPIVFYCIGKLCITTAFNLIYIITTELLPTKIRNSGLGFCSFVARFSGLVSPYIVSVSHLMPGPIGKSFPVLIFGTFSLLAGLSALLLPETRNVQLPETFEENNNSKSASESQYHKCQEDDGS